jgi:hypothetical protein
MLTIGPPHSNPEGPSTSLYFQIEEDVDLVEFRWSYGVDEEEAGFGEAEIEIGRSQDLDDAKHDCWQSLLGHLIAEGYSAEEIAGAISTRVWGRDV